MFPQVGRREIMWDLQGNGGSVAATTERILGGRGLERVSFLSFFSIRVVFFGRGSLVLEFWDGKRREEGAERREAS